GISINGTFDLNGRLIYVSGGKTRRTFEMNNVPVTVLSEQPALPGENTSSERNLQDKPVDGVVFRIQVATSSKPVPADQVAKKLGLTHGEKLIMVKTGNVYKYQTGSFTSYEQVSAMQKKLAASGLKDAFVVAYRGDKQIPVSEAVKR
ncbi:MAG: SPOR domain-containing protein, partial [Bacteroidales bacterium]